MPRRYMIVTEHNLDEAVKLTGKSREVLLTKLDTSFANTRFRFKRVRVAMLPQKRRKKK